MKQAFSIHSLWEFILDARAPEHRQRWRVSYDSLGLAGAKLFCVAGPVGFVLTLYVCHGLSVMGLDPIADIVATVGGLYIGSYMSATILLVFAITVIGIGWDLGKFTAIGVRKLVHSP